MSLKDFFGKAFKDMKESAKSQHEVDKANFDAVKAESKASFEENRGHNTFAKAKKNAKENWEAAKQSPAERQAKTKEEQEKQIVEANARKEEAEKKLEELKK